jgi:hypothetical protein
MNAAGPLMVALGLVLGVLSAVTAYLPRVDAIDPSRGHRIILHAPAGAAIDAQGNRMPLLVPGPPGQPLVIDDGHLQILGDAGVRRIHVKGFNLGLWREWWVFAIAMALLAGGAAISRRARRRELEADSERVSSTGDESPTLPAGDLLDGAHQAAVKLAGDVDALSDETARLQLIRDGIDDLRERFFEPLEAGRAAVIHQIGLSGYARVMDRFAAAERQFYRAWSAAADHVDAEATTCIGNGITLLETARTLHTAEIHRAHE